MIESTKTTVIARPRQPSSPKDLRAAVWLTPAAAHAAGTERAGVKVEEYSGWQGVRVCDTQQDGNGVTAITATRSRTTRVPAPARTVARAAIWWTASAAASKR